MACAYNFREIPGKITDRRIDLGKCYLHVSSLNPSTAQAGQFQQCMKKPAPTEADAGSSSLNLVS
jgi:hypothetical protein